MLFNRHKVRQNLRRVECIGQTVPHRHICKFRQAFNRRVLEAAEFNTIKHAAEYLCRIFNRFFLTKLNVIFAQELRRNTEIVCGNRECAARPR